MVDTLGETQIDRKSLGIKESSSQEHSRGIQKRVLHPWGSELLRRLPVGQVLTMVYAHTPELEWVSEAILSGNEKKAIETVEKVEESINKYYGLKVKYLEDKKLWKKTKDQKNKATLNLEEKTIYMAESLKEDPWELIGELAHELGAYRLVQIYGSKEMIPGGLPNLWGGEQQLAATHYLDELINQGGPNNKEGEKIIEIARQFSV